MPSSATIQRELQEVGDMGLPGALIYAEDSNGGIEFCTAVSLR